MFKSRRELGESKLLTGLTEFIKFFHDKNTVVSNLSYVESSVGLLLCVSLQTLTVFRVLRNEKTVQLYLVVGPFE